MPDVTIIIIVAMIAWFAYSIETVTGFGSSIISLTLAAHLLPVTFLVPVMAMLNVLVCGYIVIRHREQIDHRLLFRRILPLALLGLPVGFTLFHMVEADHIKWVFGLFVVSLSCIEAARILIAGSLPQTKVSSSRLFDLWLVAGGVIQGLWVSGGPLVVYWASRNIGDKGAFRTTLTALWLVLNTLLVIGHISAGSLYADNFQFFVLMLVPLVLGIITGELIHNWMSEKAFRLLIYAILIVAGLSILLKA